MKLLNWGFDCHCDICDLKEEALEESEEQLENDMNQKFEKLEEKMIPKVVGLTS